MFYHTTITFFVIFIKYNDISQNNFGKLIKNLIIFVINPLLRTYISART